MRFDRLLLQEMLAIASKIFLAPLPKMVALSRAIFGLPRALITEVADPDRALMRIIQQALINLVLPFGLSRSRRRE